MDRNFVLAYVANHPATKGQVLKCIAAGLSWGDIAAIITAAL